MLVFGAAIRSVAARSATAHASPWQASRWAPGVAAAASFRLQGPLLNRVGLQFCLSLGTFAKPHASRSAACCNA